MPPKSPQTYRRAEWRRRADDPKTPLGWWWRGIAERDRWLWLRISGLAFLALAASTGFSGRSPFTWLMLGTLLVCECLVRRRDPRRLRTLLPDPSPVDSFIADVTIRLERLTTGADVAAVSFFDGFLHVEWVRSSIEEDRLRLRLPEGQWVTFAPAARGREFCGAVREWSRGRGGASTLPPATVHPQEMARWGAWIGAGIVVIAAGILGGAVVNVLHPYDPGSTGKGIASLSLATGCAMAYLGAHRRHDLTLVSAAARRAASARLEALEELAPPLQGPSEEANVHVV